MTFDEILKAVDFLRERLRTGRNRCGYVVENNITISITKFLCHNDIGKPSHCDSYIEVFCLNQFGHQDKLISVVEDNDVASSVYANIIYMFLNSAGYLDDLENME